jgi:hypothetical protein
VANGTMGMPRISENEVSASFNKASVLFNIFDSLGALSFGSKKRMKFSDCKCLSEQVLYSALQARL